MSKERLMKLDLMAKGLGGDGSAVVFESTGYKIEKCEDLLINVIHELVSYSFLLRSLDPGVKNAEGLYGLGLSLDRLAERVSKVMDRLGSIKNSPIVPRKS
jgi:hypothetical protein